MKSDTYDNIMASSTSVVLPDRESILNFVETAVAAMAL